MSNKELQILVLLLQSMHIFTYHLSLVYISTKNSLNSYNTASLWADSYTSIERFEICYFTVSL